jgi:serine/threonine protein kinase
VLTDSEQEPQPPSQIEPNLSTDWDEILRRALARDPAHRYQSAEEFLNAIAHLEQPPVADLPLPRLRTLGIGIAAFAGLILAVIASPALDRFREVTPFAAPWDRLHIAPPAFATLETPPNVQGAPITTRRVARAAAVNTRKPASTVNEPNVDQAAVAPDAEAANPAPADPGNAAPAKRGFWSKLNVFRKRTD